MLRKLIIALVATIPAAIFAQTKVGTVNEQAIIDLMPEMALAQQQLDTLSKTYQNENIRLEEEINRKIQEYQALPATTPASIRERRQQEIQDLDQRFQAFLQNAQQDLARQRNELIDPIKAVVREAIKQVGAEQGFSMIVPANMLFYAGFDIIDLTEAVKAKLNIEQQPSNQTDM